MDADPKALGALHARLRLAREQAGLSQAQVARMLGLHRPSISEMEAGRRKVSADELRRLAQVYGVGLGWLGGGGTTDEEADPRVELAARGLAKLRPEDLDKVINLLTALRDAEQEEENP